MLRALDEANTDGLAELRSVLLKEHEWRVRVGLVREGRVCGVPMPGTCRQWPSSWQPEERSGSFSE
jgi:hypothetical protein